MEKPHDILQKVLVPIGLIVSLVMSFGNFARHHVGDLEEKNLIITNNIYRDLKNQSDWLLKLQQKVQELEINNARIDLRLHTLETMMKRTYHHHGWDKEK